MGLSKVRKLYGSFAEYVTTHPRIVAAFFITKFLLDVSFYIYTSSCYLPLPVTPFPSNFALQRAERSPKNSGIEYVMDEWQTVQAGFYIYSAYIDSRNGTTFLRVLGAKEERRRVAPTCILSDGNKKTFVAGYTDDFEHYSSNSVKPIWIICPIPATFSPISVAIETVGVISGSVRIQDSSKKPKKYKVIECLHPLFDFDEVLSLVEWIEFHTLLGVEKFTIYNFTIGPNATKVLESYGKLIEIIDWKLPFNHDDIHYYAQIVQLNDCLYRYDGVTEYVLNVDVDEFVVPGSMTIDNFTNYFDVFDYIVNDTETNLDWAGRIAGISFPAMFSFFNFKKTEVAIEKKIGRDLIKGEKKIADELLMLNFNKLSPSTRWNFKTKYVAKPRLILEGDVHWPTVFMNDGIRYINFEEDERYMRFIHFRNCSYYYIKSYCTQCERICSMLPHAEDLTAVETFGDKLLRRVTDKMAKLQPFVAFK